MPQIYLVGAGISLDPPTNFPIATTISRSLVEAIAPDAKTHAKILELFNSQRSDVRHPGDYLRFETLMEVLQLADPDLELLDFVDLYKQPNAIHLFLAQRAIAGDIIITPNFDDLIERACVELGAVPHSICSDDDFGIDRERTYTAPEVPIYKIHGSFYEYRGSDIRSARKTIQSTLSAVTAGVNDLLLTPGKLAFLKRVITDQELIVAGYSGSDDLDIVPSLKGLGFSLLQWIKHGPPSSPLRDITDETRSVIEAKQFAKLSTRERLVLDAVGSSRLRVLEANTADFLCGKSDATSFSPTGRADSDARLHDFIKKWSIKYLEKPGMREYLVGTLFFNVGRHAEEISLLDKAAKLFESNDEVDMSLKVMNGLARTYTNLRVRDKALDCISQALALIPRTSDAAAKADCLRQAGFTHYYLDIDLEKALQYFTDALQVCDAAEATPRLIEVRAHTHHDSAMLHYKRGDFTKAIARFHVSMELFSKTGDIRHVSYGHHQLGNIKYDRGDFRASLKEHETALQIATTISAASQMANSNNEIAMIRWMAGDLDESVSSFNRSLEINELYGCEPNRAIAWQNIGIVMLDRGATATALKYLNDSLDEYDKYEQTEHRPEVLCFIAECHILRRELALAKSFADQAIQLSASGRLESRLRAQFISSIIGILQGDDRRAGCIATIKAAHDAGLLALLLDQIHALAKYQVELKNCDYALLPLVDMVRKKYGKLGNTKRLSTIDRHFH